MQEKRPRSKTHDHIIDHDEPACQLEHLERCQCCQCCHWGGVCWHGFKIDLTSTWVGAVVRAYVRAVLEGVGPYFGPLNVEKCRNRESVRSWVTTV
jgi:hypothetical protein